MTFSSRFPTLGAGLVAMLAALTGCASSDHHASCPHAPGGMGRDSIVVVGHGKIRVKPDAARIQFGLEVSAPTVTEATRISAEKMTALITALKQAGIAETDLQTSNYSVHFERTETPVPVPAPKGGPPVPTGPRRNQVEGVYRVTNTVETLVRDILRVGPIIDTATAAGANNVWGVTFILDNTATAEADARAKAFADARQRAEALARLASVKLGPIASVSEVIGTEAPGNPPIPMAAYAKVATPVEAGQISYSDDVQVVYTIEH